MEGASVSIGRVRYKYLYAYSKQSKPLLAALGKWFKKWRIEINPDSAEKAGGSLLDHYDC